MDSILEILDKYYTPEDLKKLEALEEKLRALDDKYREEHGKEFIDLNISLYEKGETILVEGWKNDYFTERDKLLTERKSVDSSVADRYKEERKPEGILEDVKKIAESYTKEDYLHHLEILRAGLKKMEELEEASSSRSQDERKDSKERGVYTYLRKNSEENYTTCFLYFYENNSEIEKLLDEEDLYKAIEIIKLRIDTFGYERPSEGALSFTDQSESPKLPQLPKYDFVYPKDYKQNLTKASSTLFSSKNSLEDLRQISIDVSPNSKGLTTTYSVNVDLTAKELTGTENVTEYDKSVHDMAVSIGLANEHGFFTAKQVATALLYGDNPSNSNPSKQQVGAVTKSIEKQSLIRLTIDWTDHFKLNNKGNIPEEAKDFTITDYMLPVREVSVTIGGQKLKGYQFIDREDYTPLHHYATSVGQIGQHPVKLLNVPINLDQTKIVIRDFLLGEIAHIKKNNKWNNTITVDRLLDIAGEDSKTISRIKKKKLLDAVETMLTYWKKQGAIKDYKKTRAKTTGSPLQSFTIYT